MSQLYQWATRWNVPPAALADLRAVLVTPPDTELLVGDSEAAVQAAVRVSASRAGARLWRNNVGAGKLDNGSFVRWGLANESHAMNKQIKSADLIGIEPVLIEQQHVGQVIGRFLSVECKHAKWRYAGDDHEKAQHRWQQIVVGLGGRAVFSNGGI